MGDGDFEEYEALMLKRGRIAGLKEAAEIAAKEAVLNRGQMATACHYVRNSILARISSISQD